MTTPVSRFLLLAISASLCADWTARAVEPAPAAPNATVVDDSTAGYSHDDLAKALKASDGKDYEAIFALPRTEIAAISPDGKYLAYSLREGKQVSVAMVDIGPTFANPLKRGVLDDDDTDDVHVDPATHLPAHLRWLGWTESDRLVVESNHTFLHSFPKATNGSMIPPNSLSGAVEALNRDGGHGALLVTPKAVGMAAGWGFPKVFGFDPKDGNSVAIWASIGEGWGMFSVNASSGKMTDGPRFIPDLGPVRGFIMDLNGAGLISYSADPHIPKSSFQYETPGVFKSPRKLDEIAGFRDEGGFTLSPETTLSPRAIPITVGADGLTAYFATNRDADRFSVQSLNLKTGQISDLGLADPQYDVYEPSLDELAEDPDLHLRPSVNFEPADRFRNQDLPLVFDRYTGSLLGIRYQGDTLTAHWIDPQLKRIQAFCEDLLAGDDVSIVGWDRARRLFLIEAEGPDDPAGFYLLDTANPKLRKFASATHAKVPIFRTTLFDASLADGSSVDGQITMPATQRTTRVPAVVLMPDRPWARYFTGYNPDVTAYASMGLAVIQVDGPGLTGTGLKRLGALSGFIPSRIAAIRAAIASLADRYPIDARKVAIAGTQDGAVAAVALARDDPDDFRCAVALAYSPRLNESGTSPQFLRNSEKAERYLLTQMLKSDPAEGLITNADGINRPILFLAANELRTVNGVSVDSNYLPFSLTLASDLRARHIPSEAVEMSPGFYYGDPAARAKAFSQIETFLDATLYNFSVKIGHTHEVKS